jgi:hypothetical protein
MGLIGCSEMSETNSQFALRSIAEDAISQLLVIFTKSVACTMHRRGRVSYGMSDNVVASKTRQQMSLFCYRWSESC